MASKTVGVNVSYDVTKENKLVITVDLKKENGKSKSGKTMTIGSSKGNTKIQDEKGNEIIFGLNVYKYADAEGEEE